MSILIVAIIVILLVVMLCWGLDQIPTQQPYIGILKFLVVLLGVLVITQKAGLF